MNDYTYNEINIGHEEEFTQEITHEMENSFREITGDENPLHKDDFFARKDGKFEGHVCFGMLTASLLSTMAGMYLPGKYSLIHSIDNISFKKPVYVGDTLKIGAIVVDKQDDLQLLILDVIIRNQHNKVVLKAIMKVLVQK